MTDYKKVEEQLNSLGYTEDNLENLRVRETILELFHTLEAQDLDLEQQNSATELFYNLSQGVLLSSAWQVSGGREARWADFVVGQTRPGVTVRVRPDAYDGVGAKHNRLVGTLVAIRGGRAVVQYSGRNDGVGHYHDPSNLEVLEK
jgi:hypothetical protein